MGNYTMQVDFFGNNVRAETDGNMVSLNDIVRAGNTWRAQRGLSLKTLQQVTSNSQAFQEYLEAVERVWDRPKDSLLVVTGRGGQARTMAHVSVAVFVAEQMSAEFHALVIKTFIEGKLLEFRELGGTEFKNLNAAIDLYLPGREGKSSNQGLYINAAKLIRERLMGAGAETCCWSTATVAQTHSRYELENKLVSVLRAGMVRDWDHLKEVIVKL